MRLTGAGWHCKFGSGLDMIRRPIDSNARMMLGRTSSKFTKIATNSASREFVTKNCTTTRGKTCLMGEVGMATSRESWGNNCNQRSRQWHLMQGGDSKTVGSDGQPSVGSSEFITAETSLPATDLSDESIDEGDELRVPDLEVGDLQAERENLDVEDLPAVSENLSLVIVMPPLHHAKEDLAV
ncbi:hypothetical protein TIFTF001_007094 [Ficus carica]|uniref:Uncharacterized protein n=1 Tax=Ficus carica TaxID=3494 RepID=A0AA88A257_FICCA|nr:hypothetical protein TIFTF001_007094 [Ficus carica]